MSGSAGPRWRPAQALLLSSLLGLSACADQVVFSSNTGTACGKGQVWVSGYTTANGTRVPGSCRGGTVIVYSNLQGRVPEELGDAVPGSWELESEIGDEPMPGLLLIGDRNEGLDIFGDGTWWPATALGGMPDSIVGTWSRTGLELSAARGEGRISIRIDRDGTDRLRVLFDHSDQSSGTIGFYRRR